MNKRPKDPLLSLSTLARMPSSVLVDLSSWASLRTAETRNARRHLFGWKHESPLSAGLTPSEAFRLLVWGEIYATGFGLTYTYITSTCELFRSLWSSYQCFISQLSIQRCVVVKIATGSAHECNHFTSSEQWRRAPPPPHTDVCF